MGPESEEYVSHENLMEEVLLSIKGLDAKLDGIITRQEESEHHINVCLRGLQAAKTDISICLRGLQVLLLDRATKLQVVRSLHDVNEALLMLEAEAVAEREKEPPTVPDNAKPEESPTMPAPAPESEPGD